MDNRDMMSTLADVRLSLADWLTLLGWCGAHINESTPDMLIASIREIGRQVMGDGV